MHPDIERFNAERDADARPICEALATEIDRGLPDQWHHKHIAKRKGRLERLV